MLLKLLPILMVAALTHCRATDDIDSLIEQIFGKEPTGGGVANPTEAAIQNPTKASVDNPIKVTGEMESCSLSSGGQGVCAPYYLCDSLPEILPDGVGLVDIRGERDGPCPTYIDVCCENSKVKQ